MHVVKEHVREDGAFVPRHFKHDPAPINSKRNCSVGGESSIHQRRKGIALSKAKVLFDCSAWGEEKQIGDRQADAYIEFADDHPRFGKGLAIEYQHKNKNKDTDAVTQNYLDCHYTAVWLWPDQFDDRNVELFNGEVYPVWPHAIPGQHQWQGPNQYIEKIQESLNPPSLVIQRIGWIPKERLRNWYQEGLRKYANARERIPNVSEWTEPFEYDINPTTPEIEVKFPPELVEEHREELREVWEVYAENEYDLVRELGQSSADRNCQNCSKSADYYLYKADIESQFLCTSCANL